MRFCSLLLTLWLLFPTAYAATLSLDPCWQLLAIEPTVAGTGNPITLTPGEHHLLVRYEETLPARVNGDNDETLRSSPQLITLTVANEALQLAAPNLSANSQKQQFATMPKVVVKDTSGRDYPVSQREIKVDGFQLGVNYQQLLAAQLATSKPAAVAIGVATAVVSQPAPNASMPVEDSQLQQLFLQATPEQRKRFISWAVQQF